MTTEAEVEVGPRLFCVPCEATWRDLDVCPFCDTNSGVLRQNTDPPGWPRLRIQPDHDPGSPR